MTANDVLLVIGAVVFSLFAFLFVYLVVTKKLSRAWIAAAVFLELIVIWALIEKQPAFFGVSGLLALFMLFLSWKRRNSIEKQQQQ